MKNGKVFKIKPNLKRNEMHFQVQLGTHCNVFRDRTVYTRKEKYPRNWEF